MSSSNVLMTALIAATAVGAAAGLLLAPKPGKVTRRFVAMRAHKVRTEPKDMLVRLRRCAVPSRINTMSFLMPPRI